MAYQRGDVVLVPFPFTDLSASRVRPALVMSSAAYEDETSDLIALQITGREGRVSTDYALSDWKLAGLQIPSVVRAKPATLSRDLVQLRVGSITPADLNGIEQILRRVLGLNGSN